MAYGAAWGERSPDRVTVVTGIGHGGGIPVLVRSSCGHLKRRRGSYCPEWLLDARSRSERAFVQVVAETYARGIPPVRSRAWSGRWGSRRCLSPRCPNCPGTGPERLRVPQPASRCRPLHVCVGRCVGGQMPRRRPCRDVALRVAVGVNNEGHPILGLDIATGENGAALLAFWRSLVARGLRGVQLVNSDDHQDYKTLWQPLRQVRRGSGGAPTTYSTY